MQDFMDAVKKFISDFEHTGKLNVPVFKKIDKLFHQHTHEALEDACFAHYKHAIELLSSKINKEVTKIYYDIDKEVDILPSGKRATVQYLHGGYNITIAGKLSPKQKRILIGHELGHILISLLHIVAQSGKSEIYKSDNHNHYPEGREWLASLFCYIMHIRQSDHYRNDSLQDFIYHHEDETQCTKIKQGLLKEILTETKGCHQKTY